MLCQPWGYTEATGLTTGTGRAPSEGDAPRGCPGAGPVARAIKMAQTPQLSGVTRQLTTEQLPGGGGAADKGRSREAGLHPPAPAPRPLLTSSFPDHTPQNSQPISHPSSCSPKLLSPPHTVLSWASSSPFCLSPLRLLPSSPVPVALPVSCCPPALHLCLSEPQVINSLPLGLASSHLYPVRTNWKDRLSPRPCFPQEPTMHYRQDKF